MALYLAPTPGPPKKPLSATPSPTTPQSAFIACRYQEAHLVAVVPHLLPHARSPCTCHAAACTTGDVGAEGRQPAWGHGGHMPSCVLCMEDTCHHVYFAWRTHVHTEQAACMNGCQAYTDVTCTNKLARALHAAACDSIVFARHTCACSRNNSMTRPRVHYHYCLSDLFGGPICAYAHVMDTIARPLYSC